MRVAAVAGATVIAVQSAGHGRGEYGKGLSMRVKVCQVRGTDLHLHVQGEESPRDGIVVLDLERRILSAEPDDSVRNWTPDRDDDDDVLHFDIPPLRAAHANRLLGRIAPRAERVCDGFRGRMDALGYQGLSFDKEAERAIAEIEGLCRDAPNAYESLHVWDAADWLDPLGDAEDQAADLGITADTTDEQLDQIAGRVEEEALRLQGDGCDGLEGTVEHLGWIRAELRKVAAEEAKECGG